MSAVAKSESPVHRDARLYCRRRHQKTMGKCAREERQGDALLARQLRHIQKSKQYREKELDREQEKCLTDLVTIFDRQCQIATTRLAQRLKDALGDKDIVDGLWGQKNGQHREKPSHDVKETGKQSLLNGNTMKSFGNHPHVLPRGGAGAEKAISHKQLHNGSQLPFLKKVTKGANVSSRDYRVRPDSPRPSWQRAPRSIEPQPTPPNQPQLFKNQIGIRASVQLTHTNQGFAKRQISGQRPTRPKTAPQIGVNSWTTSRCDKLASPVRCPQHSNDTPAHLRTARSLRCLIHANNGEDKTVTPGLDAPEDVCFRRQYLACVMSRKLPVSGLRSGSFAQQDEVRKKMEARKRCMEELRMANRQRAKSAPAGLVRMSLS